MFDYPYGLKSAVELQPIELELLLFRDPGMAPQSPGPEHHFRNVCELLWPQNSHPAGFFWNPWTELMLAKSCAVKYLAVLGCASSGKSDFYAAWAIVNWLCAPTQTLVLVTSTSLKDSRQRIWGRIRHYFVNSKIPLPGKLVDSMGMIRTDDGSGSFDDAKSITLIAADQKKEKEAIGKIIGRKNKRIIFIADELPELSESILSAAYSNLSANPHFQLIGIGNFKSIYDPLGQMAEPVGGYSTITAEDTEWETKTGCCIRFDGIKSPNITAGKNKWPGIYDGSMLEEHRRTLGATSAEFWRMVRSFPCPAGDINHIYSEPDLLAGGAFEQPVWLHAPEPVAAMDPSFTNGGDRTIVALGFIGQDLSGATIIAFSRYAKLASDITLKDKPRDYQIASQFMELCVKEGIGPWHAAMDSTGAGSVLHSIVAEIWSPKVLAVNMAGSATDMLVTTTDERSAKDHYSNRVSEMWYVGVEFLKARQLRGITKDLAMEMTSRQYTTQKGIRMRITVESKKDMKSRMGYSPDIADAWCIMLDLCRTRFGAIAGSAKRGYQRTIALAQEQARAAQEIYLNAWTPQEWSDNYELYAGD